MDILQGVIAKKPCNPGGRTVVCGGAPYLATALPRLLAEPGNAIPMRPLTYPGFRALAVRLWVRQVGVPSDLQGPLPDALVRVCWAVRSKASAGVG